MSSQNVEKEHGHGSIIFLYILHHKHPTKPNYHAVMHTNYCTTRHIQLGFPHIQPSASDSS